MKSFHLKAKILSQARINKSCWHCEISALPIAKIALPGQFVNIRVSDTDEPLLRRPISIHGVSGSKIKILYEVVGRATEILAQKRVGEYLDIIGPLGHGFDLGKQKTENRRQILVAGGMGVAPLVFLAEKFAKLKTVVLIGARSKEELLCVKDFKKLGCDVRIATDDGSSGFKGRVSGLLEHLLTTNDQRPTTIYACGPKPMLKPVADISRERKITSQLSLEEHMACGIGACLGCVVQTKEGFKRVCQEGPVFCSEELTW